MAQEHSDDEMKALAAKLGAAVNNTITTSDKVLRVVAQIKELGYDIALVWATHVGLSPINPEDAQSSPITPKEVAPKVVGEDVVPGTFTVDDIKHYLKHFRIGF
jgi:hypothetical protein